MEFTLICDKSTLPSTNSELSTEFAPKSAAVIIESSMSALVIGLFAGLEPIYPISYPMLFPLWTMTHQSLLKHHSLL